MKTDPPTWFRRAVADGLKVLVALSLPNEPALDLMPATKQLWIHLLWNSGRAWEQDLDTPRILEGFTRLGARVERWPAPKQLLDALPPRPRPPLLEPPPVDREHGKRQVRELRRMLKGVPS